MTSSERRISRKRPFRAAPGGARPDWWMFTEVGRRMGWPEVFAWAGPADVFREHAAVSGLANAGRRLFDISALATLDDAAYDALKPVRWPCPAGGPRRAGGCSANAGSPRRTGAPGSWRRPTGAGRIAAGCLPYSTPAACAISGTR